LPLKKKSHKKENNIIFIKISVLEVCPPTTTSSKDISVLFEKIKDLDIVLKIEYVKVTV